MAEQFDVVVIGGGPGGYVAAIRAAQLGLKTACVEKRGALGGTCLNVGCIPSKALLHSSEIYEEVKEHGKAHGITATGLKVDVKTMLSHKNDVVKNLTQGIEGLFKKNKVTYYKGHGIILGKGEVAVKPVDGKGTPESIKTKNVIIATGSDVVHLPNVPIDEKRIVSSTGALDLPEVPKSMIVIGAGVIGLEMGSVWRRLGAEVTVVEFMDHITPGQDMEVSRQFQKILEKQGMKFKLATKVTGAKSDGKSVTLTAEPKDGGKAETLKADVVLVAIGRKPYTDNLGLKEAGVAVDERGRIQVDAHFETNVKGIYAIGDVIPGPMLAHKAEEDGVACAEIIAGQKGHVNYNLVPGVIYTNPEVAAIGKTEEALKKEGRAYNVGKFPFLANSRARATGKTDGFVKILADQKTDEVLGVHIIGAQAGTIIAEVAVAMEFKASAEDIARTCHSHPDLNEAVKEAALAVAKRPIHI
ncbi:MAG: dihydrolipoyl dehydrogenase [Proteobacteria bacterium]|nr:dihydrolipoyl dehydrogenase [Pseudomonadota bacterium]